MNKQNESGIVPFPEQPKKSRVQKEWFFMDSKNFWTREDLSVQEKAICTVLRSYANSAGQAWPTHIQIGQALQLHPVTICRHLKSLRKKGEVTWEDFRDEAGHNRHLYVVPLFKNPYLKIVGMGHPHKIPPLTVTIVKKKLFIMAKWCKEGDASPGLPEDAVRQIEARHGPAL